MQINQEHKCLRTTHNSPIEPPAQLAKLGSPWLEVVVSEVAILSTEPFRTKAKLLCSSAPSAEPFLSLTGINCPRLNPSISCINIISCAKLFPSCDELLKDHLARFSGIGARAIRYLPTRQDGDSWVRFGFTTKHPFSRWTLSLRLLSHLG